MQKIISKGRHVLGKLSRSGDKSAPRNCEAALTWELRDAGAGKLEFSACGELWNHLKTDIVQGGQCVDQLAAKFPRDRLAQRIRETWSAYHLNGMNAGTPEQTAALARAESAAVELLRATNSPAGCFYHDGKVNWHVAGDYITGEKGAGHFGWACAVLKQAGVYEVPVTDELRAAALGGLPEGASVYRYGTRWLHYALPAEVVALILRGFQDVDGEPLEADAEEAGEPERDLIAEAGLTVESVFIPFSLSRNAKEKTPSLNWRVTIKAHGRDVLTAYYSAGSAHCPAYKRAFNFPNSSKPDATAKRVAIAEECETGRRFITGWKQGEAIKPAALDVIRCLLLDASAAFNARGFADWCDDLGFNADSIKDRAIYDESLAHAVAMRGAIGARLFEDLLEGNA